MIFHPRITIYQTKRSLESHYNLERNQWESPRNYTLDSTFYFDLEIMAR